MIYLLSQIVDASADRFAEREAFRFKTESLSYETLAIRSTKLARVLIEQGVNRWDRVGIYLNKGLELPVAVYGVMKAGAAYVPLDPSTPVSRLKFVIRDCGIRCLITNQKKAAVIEKLAAETDLECVIGANINSESNLRCLSWDDVFAANDASISEVTTVASDLAYVMYTSGTTGYPKGIMHTHYSGLSYAQLAAKTYSVSHQDRLGNHSPLHFDMSTFDYFSGPLSGATTVIIPEEYTKLPASMSKLIQDEELSIWYSVPFALIQLVQRGSLEQRDLGALRWIMFGGEPFPLKHLRSLMSFVPDARFSNVYGPAEVNQCTYFHFTEGDFNWRKPVSIGREWKNTEGLIINEDDEPITNGEIGELVIRSATMMKGYWGREELTERSWYYRSTYSSETDKFYRTGDLVQLMDDGNYQFIGRKDRQIKVRGHRVELDEIESAILTHDQTSETAVFAVDDNDGSNSIIAAVIPKVDQPLAVADLINYLNGRLPRYAVPAELIVTDSFPRTATGKIDRRELTRRTTLETGSRQNNIRRSEKTKVGNVRSR